MFLHFSLPERLHSDQGRQFESSIMEELCSKTRTTPYHSQERERTNRTISNNHQHWESELSAWHTIPVFNRPQDNPHFLMFGRRARIPVDMLCGVGRVQAIDGVEVGEYMAKQKQDIAGSL